MTRTNIIFALGTAGALVAGCASAPQPAAADPNAAEPLAHQYRTGSLIVQKEKHVTTDEERKQAQDAAAAIRATSGVLGSPGR